MDEIEILKEDIAEIKETVKEVASTVNDMRVFLAGNYLTRLEFEKFRETEEKSRRWWAGFVIAAASLIMGIISLVMRYFA